MSLKCSDNMILVVFVFVTNFQQEPKYFVNDFVSNINGQGKREIANDICIRIKKNFLRPK